MYFSEILLSINIGQHRRLPIIKGVLKCTQRRFFVHQNVVASGTSQKEGQPGYVCGAHSDEVCGRRHCPKVNKELVQIGPAFAIGQLSIVPQVRRRKNAVRMIVAFGGKHQSGSS
jgi:hypothetical protein